MPETPDTTLVIRHLENTAPPQFEVLRPSDAKPAGPFSPPPAAGFPVEGRPDSDLLQELRWYLEDFLTYPFPPETDHAKRVLKALQDWGEQSFRALFANRDAGRMFDAATAADYANLRLQISSDDPRILAWPWEALRNDEIGVELAHTCRIERKLNALPDPRPIPEALPQDRIRILLVVCRPYGDEDVRFRSVARPVVDLIESQNLPAEVEVLRPPTFPQLREHLRQHKGRYHILHFDGHGANHGAPAHNGYQLTAPEGLLVFETEEGKPDPITASTLNKLLVDSDVPTVVLNACQSAMQSQDAVDPFASVAAALLRAGTRAVVAMSYSLYVSGAQEFLPAFYSRLFDSGRLPKAVMAGRQRMLEQPKRVSARGPFELSDWLLPVIYQQEQVDFSFAAEAERTKRESKLNDDLRGRVERMQFIGHDGPLLELERAMRLRPAGILIHGLGGVGKTTLAAGFLDWLDKTGGLDHPPFWFDFREIRSAEFVVNSIGTPLFGGNFPAMGSLEQRIDGLAQALKENPFVIVWDNFESAAGLESVGVPSNLPPEDREVLRRLLDGLYQGKSKVLITSRSEEKWLPAPRCRGPKVELPGLDGEERWEFCGEILRDLGITVNREDPELAQLMDMLRGHPLAMRAVLPKLETTSPAQLMAKLKSNLAQPAGDEQWDQVQATIRLVVDAMPPELQPLLSLVGMHEAYVDGDHLEAMAGSLGPENTHGQVDDALAALATVGLVRELGQAVYEMHPALTGFLRGRGATEPSARSFVEVMGSLAQQYTSKELHEQRVVFQLHGANFRFALAEAGRLGMEAHLAALTQALATYALHDRDYSEAERLYQELAERRTLLGDARGRAAAYHNLGRVALGRRDFEAAEQWNRKSLAIKENQGDEQGAATSYHQLGMVAEERRDFEAAERWYRESLAIKEKQGDEPGAAISYHQLGNVAEERRDFAAAEQWYLKSLAIREKQGDEHHAAASYHNMGAVAQERRDFSAAEQWYLKSLAIAEKHGNEHAAAGTYSQLGIVAQLRRDFEAAEKWYLKSLAIEEKQGNEHGTARSYHQLGRVAEKRRDFDAAGRWYLRALEIYSRTESQHNAQIVVRSFLRAHQLAPPTEQSEIRKMWEEAGLPWPEDTNADAANAPG